MAKFLARSSRRWRKAAAGCSAMAVLLATLAAPASANPLAPPTVDYIADVEITRATDHSFEVPARYILSGRRVRVDFVGIDTLVDLDRHQTTILIPRVRTY